MDKFEVLVEVTQNLKLLFNKILYRFDIVIGSALYFFNCKGVLKAEIEKSLSSVAIWTSDSGFSSTIPG